MPSRSLKVLLVNPPDNNSISSNIPEYVGDSALPPLGLLYIATYLSNNSNHKVKILDAHLQKLQPEEIANFAEDYDVIGITTLTFSLVDVIQTVNSIRRINHTIPIVLGGPHLAIFPEESIKIKGVSFCLRGESDISFLMLIDRLAEYSTDYSDIPGLYWKSDNRVKGNADIEFINDLDQLPIPNRTLLDFKSYASVLSSKKNSKDYVTTAFSSRGCPYKCTFCDRPNLGKSFRANSAQRVVNEISSILDLGIREILFYDDTFAIKKNRVLEICELILERKLKFKWDIRTRVNDVDQKMLNLMKKAGCSRINFGVESGNDQILRSLKKGITKKIALKTFKLTRKEGIETLGYFMFGCQDETRSQMHETLNFAKELKPDYAHFAILTPFPGTPIYKQALKEGWFDHDHWAQFALAPSSDFIPPFLPNTIQREELIKILKYAYKSFYFRPPYLFHQLLKVRSTGDFVKKAMIAKNMVFK
jgi:anaerobic magnesium-protoporphyrin IX monomethyl ester cyclase